jgi:SNF family Na+-dependent transporter
MGISLLPLGIFPILVLAQITSLDQRGLPLMIAVLSQLWVIILSARGISVQFFIRMERAGIISLISIYAMVLLGLIIGF